MSFEDTPQSPVVGAYELGENLAMPGRSVGAAVMDLSIDLAAIGCPAEITPSETETLTGYPYRYLLKRTDTFSNMVRIATRHIAYRQDTSDTLFSTIDTTGMVSHVQRMPLAEVDVEELLANTTEGATWTDPKKQACRESHATETAQMLRAMKSGLHANGYPKKLARADMRAEFESLLDSSWGKGSYRSFSESFMLDTIMRRAGLRNIDSTRRSIVRTARFGHRYGFGLMLQRLSPEK